MLWIEVVLAAIIGVPLLVIAGLMLLLAVGGVVGCGECVLRWAGMPRFAPAVLPQRAARPVN